MDKHLQLEFALARAEAELASAATCAAIAEDDQGEAIDRLEKARYHCRQMRAVYVNFHHSAALAFPCLVVRCDFLFSPSATCWTQCLDDTHRNVPDWTDSEHCPYRPATSLHRRVRSAAASEANPRTSVTASKQTGKILRPALGLIALILAYLFYFHVDIQLQILRLPLLFWLPIA